METDSAVRILCEGRSLTLAEGQLGHPRHAHRHAENPARRQILRHCPPVPLLRSATEGSERAWARHPPQAPHLFVEIAWGLAKGLCFGTMACAGSGVFRQFVEARMRTMKERLILLGPKQTRARRLALSRQGFAKRTFASSLLEL
jgi:hypothetical protein